MENKPNYYAIIPANVRYDKDLSPNAKLLYGEITALCNAEGFCWATNAYFTELYNVTKRSIQGWLSQLEAKGFIRVEIANIGNKESSRKIYINFTSEENFTTPRKNFHGRDEKNFTTPHEKNFTHNTTSINTTNNNTKNKNNSSISSEIEREFEQLWKIYPRKIGKKKAFDAYKKARKVKKIPYESIEKGLYRYITYLEHRETEEQFIQHGSTWFNGEQWQNEYVCTATRRKPKNPLEMYHMEFGGNGNEHGGNSQIFDYHEGGISEFAQELHF